MDVLLQQFFVLGDMYGIEYVITPHGILWGVMTYPWLN